MKNKRTTKIIASALVIASMMAVNPVRANAAWKQNSTGWWYTEGNSLVTGWKLIDGNWYYFYSDGYMATNTTIDGYYLNRNGAWTTSQSLRERMKGQWVSSIVSGPIFEINDEWLNSKDIIEETSEIIRVKGADGVITYIYDEEYDELLEYFKPSYSSMSTMGGVYKKVK